MTSSSPQPAEARAMADGREVAIALCDQRMPNMTGLQFFGRVRKTHPRASRVVMTGYTDLEDIVALINEAAFTASCSSREQPPAAPHRRSGEFESYRARSHHRAAASQSSRKSTATCSTFCARSTRVRGAAGRTITQGLEVPPPPEGREASREALLAAAPRGVQRQHLGSGAHRRDQPNLLVSLVEATRAGPAQQPDGLPSLQPDR